MQLRRILNHRLVSGLLFNVVIHARANPALEAKNDTLALNDYCYLALQYSEVNRDSSIYYAERALEVADRLKQKFYRASILSDLGYTLLSNGDYGNALEKLLSANKLIEDRSIANQVMVTPFFTQYFTSPDPNTNRVILIGYIKNSLAMLYGRTENFTQQLAELKEAKRIIEAETNDPNLSYTINNNIANAYLNMGQLDSALTFQLLVLEIEKKMENKNYSGASYKALGDIFFRKGRFEEARTNYLFGLDLMGKGQNTFYQALTQFALADTYRKLGRSDSSLYYAKAGIANYRTLGSYVPEMEEAYVALALSFKDEQRYDSAFYYLQIAKTLSDSVYSKEIKSLTAFQNMGFKEQLRLKEAEADQAKIRTRNQIILLLGGLLFISAIAFILYRSNRLKIRANFLLAKQKQQIEKTLEELKSTQAQLIQAEKMASLGELTAGIAHEIQNPLNFVNNFSEVTQELIDELTRGLKHGQSEEAEVIAHDIKQILEKITHHGKRADAIVKSMLQHSRTSTGQKELTDINALCDEYIRLAYHGQRARDKAFNVHFETILQADLPKIAVAPADLGRVLLNLINNAFYAVNEQALLDHRGFEPRVTIETKLIQDAIEIRVTDNGRGIPEAIRDKIFQPFFTTKPTGQGTGLGLSLAYDIITKGHGGTIEVFSDPGLATVFSIILPVS